MVPFDICNQEMTKKNISKMIDLVYRHCGQKETVIFCDRIMALGFTMPSVPAFRSARDDMVIRIPRRSWWPKQKRWRLNMSSSTMTA